MIGQNLSLPYLIPLAIEHLQQDPLAAGDFYEGDLLKNVLSVDPNFWPSRSDLRHLIEDIVSCADPFPKELHKALKVFRNQNNGKRR